MRKKLILTLWMATFCFVAKAQNVNSSLDIDLMSFSSHWSGGSLTENYNMIIRNHSDANLMMAMLKIYDYQNPYIVYYSPNVVSSYIAPNSYYAFTFTNNTGTSLKYSAWVVELNYFNMTTGGALIVKKALKPANTIGSNMTLTDISDTANGIDDLTVSNGESAVCYSLTGVRRSSPQRGINIVNGKKMFVE